MIPGFGDTSYYLAILVPQDVNHGAADGLARQFRRRVVTHEFILLEIGNFLSGSGSRAKFEPFVRSLRADRFTTILTASSDLLNRGVALYHDRLDKTWSLTDCISFEIMRERGITDALTADRHFEQAGFNILLKSPQ
ncbi:MAG TPA: PIN domain-containing protein [Tepidisphaeraceae bacterium]|nr:PIN domain-containing protein [Tepidisphaeraceae bacterium]